MNKLSLKLIVGLALVVCLAATAFAQPGTTPPRVQLIVRDNGTGLDTLTFGNERGATRCIDTAFGEQELPPAPPSGVFDVRMIEFATGAGDCMGQGLRMNIRDWSNTTAAEDTIKVKMQAGDPGGPPFTISWDADISNYYTTCVMKDIFGGVILNLDMRTNTSVTLNPAILEFLVYATPIINGVLKESDLVPQKFELQHNYPNPFNPTTTVKFSIEKTAVAKIAVYDILGRQIATLANEELTAGFYSVTWNGTDASGSTVGSGVYYIRMTAKVQGDDAFSAVQKVMLMK